MNNKIKKNLDLIIAIIPKITLEPLSGPAILKAVAEKNGYSCKTKDFNIDLWHRVRGTKWKDLLDPKDLHFMDKNLFDKLWEEYLFSITLDWINEIKNMNTRWLGITLFSDRNELFIKNFLEIFRKKLPYVKIIIGGPATIFFGKYLKEKGLIDAYVFGEGGGPLIGALKGDLNVPGLNDNSDKKSGLYKIPTPDYSDYDFSSYPTAGFDYDRVDYSERGLNELSISGSMGCINNCFYCDNKRHSPKYLFRDGKSLAAEMISLNKKHPGIEYFSFSDALINGNIKEMKKMSEILFDYCRNKEYRIGWGGRFACRPMNQMNSEDYRVCAKGGLSSAGIGIESASENIRKKMNKLFTNDDMHFMIEQCEKNDIVMCWGMIVGYPGETEDDFQETLDFFSRYSYLNEKNMVNGVDLGPTLMIVRGTPLFEKAASLEIDNHSPIDWVHKKTGNTIKVRIDRWMRLREHCLKLGYKVNDSEINMLKEKLKQIKECE